MTTDTLVELFWSAAVLVVFLLGLVVPATIIESRWGRSWIRRLRDLENGRRRQQAEWIDRHTWKGP